jgi:hypothetical protein
MSETTAEPTTAPTEPTAPAPAPVVIAPKTARFKLPTGVVTPIELRNALVTTGVAPETLKPQQMYAYVKAPGKQDPFPVKFYEENGTVHDTQPGGILTRPGIPTMDLGVEWYKRRATKPAVAATATTPAATAVTDAPEDESDGETTTPVAAAASEADSTPLEEAE